MGVGPQEYLLAVLLGLLQRAEQVGGEDVLGGGAGVEVTVEIGMDAGRRTLAGTIARTRFTPLSLRVWRTPSTSA